MILGIAGTLGAGKGTVVEYLKEKGFAHYSSSDVLRRILKERNVPQDREHMSPLANELLRDYEGGVLHFSHQYAVEADHKNFILEALHRVSEAEYLKKIGGIIIGVDTDIETRYQRVKERGDGEKDAVSYEQFISDSKREEEGEGATGPNIRAVMNMADCTLTNDGTLEELHAQIEDFFLQYNI